MISGKKRKKFMEEMRRACGERIETCQNRRRIEEPSGERIYDKWTKAEREAAIGAVEGFLYINERKLPKRHPYRRLNEGEKLSASLLTYLNVTYRAQKSAEKSKLVFKARAA